MNKSCIFDRIAQQREMLTEYRLRGRGYEPCICSVSCKGQKNIWDWFEIKGNFLLSKFFSKGQCAECVKTQSFLYKYLEKQ